MAAMVPAIAVQHPRARPVRWKPYMSTVSAGRNLSLISSG